MASVRFIHTADIHLGAPLGSLASAPEAVRERLADASFRALERIVDACLDQQVDCLLIAGDLYDREARSVRASEFLAAQFARLDAAKIQVFIIHGNHDPLGDHEEPIALPGNVRVFGHESVEAAVVHRDGQPVARVMGQSYRSRVEPRKLHGAFRRGQEDVVQLGLLHTALDPESERYVPCSLAELREHEGVDYWALGHVHRCRVLSEEYPYIAYPGTPQGRHAGEPGLGGCLLVELDRARAPEVRFLPTADVVWLQREVPAGAPAGREAVEGPPTGEDEGEAAAAKAAPRNLDQLHGRLLAAGEAVRATGVEALARELPVPLASTGHPLAGFAVRWTVSGRGPIHRVVAGDDEAREVVLARLRRELGQGSPFLWSESVRFETAAPLPDLAELAAKDPVLAELERVLAQLDEEPQLHEELAAQVGEVWERAGEPEDLPADALHLSDRQLARLVARARDLVIDRLVAQREEGAG